MEHIISNIHNIEELKIKKPELFKKIKLNKNLGFCNHCSFLTKKLIKCTKCKEKYCLSCLTLIDDDKNILLCFECLQEFINKEVKTIIVKKDNILE